MLVEERRREGQKASAVREGDWEKWERKAPKWLLSDAKTEEPFQGGEEEDRDFLRIGSH